MRTALEKLQLTEGTRQLCSRALVVGGMGLTLVWISFLGLKLFSVISLVV